MFFLALNGLLAGPALAEHTVVQEEVSAIPNCQVLDAVLDLGQGYPAFLGIMSRGDNAPPTIRLNIRVGDPSSSSLGVLAGTLGGPLQGWQGKNLELDTIGSTANLHTYSLGPCKESESGNCLSAGFVHTSGGQPMTTTYQQPLTDEGYFVGSSTVQTRPLAWPAGCVPLYIGVTPGGLHHAGWCGGGLYYLGPNDQAPTMLAGSDGVSWPFGGDPPTSLGFDENNNPYVVTIGAEDIYAYLNQDPAQWTTVTEPLPPGTVLGESTVIKTSDGAPPSAAVVTGDQILRWEYLKETKLGEFPKDQCGNAVQTVYVKKHSGAGWMEYFIFQCADTGALFIRLHLTTLNSHYQSDHLGIEGVFAGMALLSAKVDANNDLHVATRVNDVDDDGNPIQKTIWTKVNIDEDSINWHEGQ